MKKIVVFPLFILSFLLFTSCGSTKKVAYFQNHDKADMALSARLYDARIMPKDVLQIQVFTMTPAASEPFNLMKGSMMSSSSQSHNQSQNSV
jgi:polysaccharide export outer membrane protein